MKKKLLLLLAVGALGAGGFWLYGLFSKKYEHLNLIPNDAIVVGTFDLHTLAEKANIKAWDSLYLSKRSKEMKAKMSADDEEMRKFLKEGFGNPLSMGIDPMSDLYAFITLRGGMKPGVGVAFAVRSSSDLEKILMSIPDKFISEKKVVNGKGFKSFGLENNMLLAWKEGAGLLLGGEMDQAALQYWAEELMNMEKAKSITQNKYFNEFANGKQDLGVFINYSGALSSGPIAGLLAMAGQNKAIDYLKTSSAIVNLNFENDQLVSNTYYYNSNSKASDEYSFLANKAVSKELLNNMTDRQPLGLLSFSLDANKTWEFFEGDPTFKRAVKEMEQSLNMKFKDLKTILSGEVAACLIDVQQHSIRRNSYEWNEATGEYAEKEVMDTMPMPIFSLSMGIGNQANLHSLLKNIGTMDSAGMHMLVNKEMNIYFAERGATLTITNDATLAQKVVGKTALGQWSGSGYDLAANNGSALYLNLLFSSYPENLKTMMLSAMDNDAVAKAMFVEMITNFVDLQATGNSEKAVLTLNMSKTGENSLWRMIKMVDKIAETVGKREEAGSDVSTIDEAAPEVVAQ
ncbi:MAG: hypothetical protein RIQ89_765 [Bacteroidota bacterium]|jgi:hypothetical protein